MFKIIKWSICIIIIIVGIAMKIPVLVILGFVLMLPGGDANIDN